MPVEIATTDITPVLKDLDSLKAWIRDKGAAALTALNLPRPSPEVSVLLTDNPKIRELNHAWRGEDQPTDVLSFPMHVPRTPGTFTEPIECLGDIIISVEYAKNLVSSSTHRDRVAGELGVDPSTLNWSLREEVLFLFIHGALHLVGYDHLNGADEAQMKLEEKRLWLAATAPAP